ncbi:MAG: hypothetical protein AAGC69_22540, partial [Paracraurococcus sp.]
TWVLNGDQARATVEHFLAKDQVRAYARAAGQWAPRFTDDEGARREGLPGMITPGNMSMGLLTTLFSILAPVLGEAGAGIAMSLATACAVIGRTVVGMALPPGLDRRLAGSANFLLQATGCALLAAAPQSGAALLAGVLLFGLGIGNLLSLPPLIAQVEWPAEQVTAVLALLTAVNQGFYAFGPALFGSALEAWGPAAPPFLALALQIAAAAVLLTGRRGLTARAGG